jgi:hypothetical protein
MNSAHRIGTSRFESKQTNINSETVTTLICEDSESKQSEFIYFPSDKELHTYRMFINSKMFPLCIT